VEKAHPPLRIYVPAPGPDDSRRETDR